MTTSKTSPAPDAAASGTAAASAPPAAPSARPPLVTRPLMLRFVTVIGASASFFLLLSVVPLYAQGSGAGGSAAGLATGALMLSTVLGELVTPRLVARYGYRRALTAGLVLLGAPALVLTASHGMAWIAAVCLLRGLGFALTVVAGGALTAALIPAERRGEGLALAGIVSGVPSLLALPLGVWLAAHVGYTPVALAGGVLALAVVVVVPGLPGRESAGPVGDAGDAGDAADAEPFGDAGPSRPSGPSGPSGERPVGVIAGFRTASLARPAAIFATTALGAGIIVTFLPLAVPSRYSGLVAAALFVQPAASTLARWFAGRIGDRRGAAGLVLPGLLLSAAGILLTALTGSPVAVLGGVALFGVGFGVAQNSTLSLMYSRVPASGYGTVSALWNFGYDAGMGVGAVGFGAVAAWTGYPAAFAVTAALMLAALVPALRDRTAAPALDSLR